MTRRFFLPCHDSSCHFNLPNFLDLLSLGLYQRGLGCRWEKDYEVAAEITTSKWIDFCSVWAGNKGNILKRTLFLSGSARVDQSAISLSLPS